MNFVAASTDPQQKMVFQAIIVFWTIFMLKNIYHYAWLATGEKKSEETQAAVASRTRAATATADGATRRRRAQRA